MQNFKIKFAATLVLFLISILSLFGSPEPGDPEIKLMINQLTKAKFDSCEAGDVSNITIKRDVASFELLEGKIYFFSPTQGKTIYALFQGEGIFYYTPPTEVERKQLYRFAETEYSATKFENLFLFFTDTTYSEVSSQINLSKEVYTDGLRHDILSSIDFISEDDHFDPYLLRACIDDSSSIFYSHIVDREIFFEINPYLLEESFYKEDVLLKAEKPGIILTGGSETINLFRSQNALENKFEKNHSIQQYNLNIYIEDDLDIIGESEIIFSRLPKTQNWFFLSIDEEFEIDSVFWNKKETASFFKGEDSPIIWIRINDNINPSEENSLTINYSGDILDKDRQGWVTIRSTNKWYPQRGIRERSNFDLKFNTPDNYNFISVGELIEEKTEDDRLLTHWKFNQKYRAPSFNLGYFDITEFEFDNLPKFSIHRNEGVDYKFNNTLAKLGYLPGSNMDEVVGSDIINSYNFFSKLFGSLSYKEIRVSEIPGLHGEAFPGFIHLSWFTFFKNSTEGLSQLFRAHEVAHQWWGIGVDFDTYHDQWLSEGFAEYSGLWYMQTITQDNELFLDLLDEWKEQIINNRKYIFGSGQEAGPVWLGFRTKSTNTESDYDLIVYKKGAWILHMLRNMLLDVNTMSDNRFTNMMRDFFNTFKGMKANTEDFQNIVSKHCNMDMKWFFDQWVRGTEIPTYKYKYMTEENSDGTYKLNFIVEQVSTNIFFRSFMPIKLIFENGQTAVIKVDLNEPVKNIQLTPLPSELDEIEFNYLNSVLCEYEEIDWE